VSFKDATFISKKLSWGPLVFKVAPFLSKKCSTPFKEIQLPSGWKEQHLKEMFYSPKLNPLHLLKVTPWFENMQQPFQSHQFCINT
jgi:hypothetical protein